MKKNEEYIVDIIDYGMNGEGIAKINGITVFVQGALKNEQCKIHITKVLSSHAFAKVIDLIKPSNARKEKDCKSFPRCGGCSLRHISYNETLEIKRLNVQTLVNKMFPENNIIVEKTIGMDTPLYYRNKAIYPINADKEIGMFASRSHNIIPFEECKIQTKLSQKIAKYIVNNWNDSIYDEKTQRGLLRNIMIRESFNTNEVMCVIVQNGKKNIQNGKINSINIEELIKEFPSIKTVIININNKNTNVVLSDENIPIYGEGFIIDELCGYRFKISTNSFYQVNPVQTEKIYNLAIKEANLKKTDILCDLYCGIGTIGIVASKKAKKVYGIEVVEQAIKDARENARLNNIENIEFIQGDVEKSFNRLIKENTKPDVVIVDPPRKGLDKTTIDDLNRLKLKKIIYVSCNPSTLVRDLKLMKEEYDVEKITPIDNFCYSTHVETVTILNKRRGLK